MMGRFAGPGERRALRTANVVTVTAIAIAVTMGLLGPARPAAAGAPGGGRVIILQQNPLGASARRCLTRVREELVAGGFEVTIAEFGAGVDPLWVIDPKDQRDGSLATIALVGDPEAGASELWIVDRVAAGRSAVRRIMVPAGDAGRGAEVVAIRALEFLRASTLELVADSAAATRPAMVQAAAAANPAPAATAGSPPAAASPLTPSAPEPRRLALEAGVSVLDSGRALDAAIVPLARLRVQATGALAARLTLAGLGSRPKLNSVIGSASVGQALGLLELAVMFRPGTRIRPSISLGAGALSVSVDGQGAAPYQGQQGRRWAALLDGGVGVSAGFQHRLAVALELHALLAAPYPAVRFAGAEAARIGRPSLLATLTLVTPL